MRIYEYRLISKIIKFSKVDLNSNFESKDVESISENRKIFESLVGLISNELRYRSEKIDAEDGFLILENWIRGGMEAGF
jgi:hypothetical protein